MNKDSIEIKDLEELKIKMKAMEFRVSWKVTSKIGPDWIGSTREIFFYLDSEILINTEFINGLKNELITSVPIPKESEDHVITGEGDIKLVDDRLKISYFWEAAIPYGHIEDSANGELFFYS